MPAKKLKALEDLVKARLAHDKSGHDYAHVMRVLSNALLIAKGHKGVDKDILTTACLLHDIVFDPKDPKVHHIESAKESKAILPRFGFSAEEIERIAHAIINHNRGFAKESAKPAGKLSLEAKILCDADRMDALGAIGIVRMVQFSTKQGVPYFMSKGDGLDQSIYGSLKYMANQENEMLTAGGERLVKKRVKIMQQFVKELEEEVSWKS